MRTLVSPVVSTDVEPPSDGATEALVYERFTLHVDPFKPRCTLQIPLGHRTR